MSLVSLNLKEGDSSAVVEIDQINDGQIGVSLTIGGVVHTMGIWLSSVGSVHMHWVKPTEGEIEIVNSQGYFNPHRVI